MRSRQDQGNQFLETLHRALPLFLVALFVVGLLALHEARVIVLVTLVGLGLGVLISPIVELIHRRFRLPVSAGAAVMAILLLGLVLGIGYLVANLIGSQLVPVLEKLPEAFASVRARYFSMISDIPWIEEGLEDADFGSLVRDTLGTLFASLQMTALVLGMIVYVIALSVYLSASPRRYLRGLLSLLPCYARPRTRRVMRESGSELRRWFVAQLVSMTFVGILTGAGLLILGVEQWLLIATLTAILEFIPYIGPILGGAMALLVTLAASPDKVLWVLALYVVIQQTESNVITPLVLKKGVQLPPVHLLVLAMILGSLFGLLGIFLTAPFLTVVRSVYLQTYARKMNRLRRRPERISLAA